MNDIWEDRDLRLIKDSLLGEGGRGEAYGDPVIRGEINKQTNKQTNKQIGFK